jgi:hypothetical protein
MKTKRWYKYRGTYKHGYGHWYYQYGTLDDVRELAEPEVGDPDGLRATQYVAIKSPPPQVVRNMIANNERKLEATQDRLAFLRATLHLQL